jgi:hypothetical protein
VSERHAVLCCALLSLSVVLGPATGLVRAAGNNHEFTPPSVARREVRSESTLEFRDGGEYLSHKPERRAPRATAEVEATPTPAPTGAVAPEAVAPVAESPAAEPPPAAPASPEAPPPAPKSVLDGNQVVVFYGTPLSSGMGILGMFSPDEASARVRQEAGYYDQLNGDGRGAVPAMDLIYSMVQAEPTGNGLFLRYLNDHQVHDYLDVAERDDVQLILDLQIGRGDVLDEVRKIEPYLKNPRVHVAIDPEYAVGSAGVPISTPGRISGAQINDVQAYLADLSRENNIPPKMLIVHQYLEDTIENGGDVRFEPGVDLIINMDGIGQARDKVEKYEHFAARSYAEHKGFNVFLNHDDPPMSERDVLELQPFPDMVFYQ